MEEGGIISIGASPLPGLDRTGSMRSLGGDVDLDDYEDSDDEIDVQVYEILQDMSDEGIDNIDEAMSVVSSSGSARSLGDSRDDLDTQVIPPPPHNRRRMSRDDDDDERSPILEQVRSYFQSQKRSL
jgi:hypothetical protein